MDKKQLPSELDGLYTLESCESTNTWALEQLPQLAHGDVVFTRNQTAGRGQFDRVWLSQPGILTASFVLDLAIVQLSGLSLVAGLAVIHAIETVLPAQRDKLCLKWPNDVFTEDRKLAGILCESRLKADQARAVVGIGLNNATVPDTVPQAISLSQISAIVPDESALLTHLRQCLMRLCQQSLTDLLPEIRSRDILFGKAIVFESSDQKFIGEGAGIDQEGQLLIRLPEGVRAFRSGRVVEIR